MLQRNISLLTDFYELTMANGYLSSGVSDKVAYFDMFFRNVPENGGFVIMSGVDQILEYVENLSFSDDDIKYLKSQNLFDDNFLTYLKDFEFKCDMWAVREGTPVFPTEPIITVRGPIIQAQLIETILLLCINHQSLIATKANRIIRAAAGRPVMEFGARRAQGGDAAIYGARAAYIGGTCGTSCTSAGKMFNIPVLGTMAHSWVQMFDTELEAFKAYARLYPQNCMLLVDTYNVIKSGVPNAIKTFKEEVLPRGYRPAGVRIDSGDITYLSGKIRKMLDEAGFEDAKICVSNSLDEHIIQDMITQGAKIDSFGVGERLITSDSSPILGGVYKLCAVEDGNGVAKPKIKISENVSKINIPGVKDVYRIIDNKTQKAIADVITCKGEVIDEKRPYEIFDPEHVWKRKTIADFRVENIREQVLSEGKRCVKRKTVSEIREFCKKQTDMLWDEVKRFENPHRYYVDLSMNLWTQKNEMVKRFNR